MSIQRSISGIMNSKGSIRHNNREFIAPNVDSERIKDNIILCRQDIRKAYHELFDKSLSEYNAKQKRKDRVIPDYYEHINRSNQEHSYYEAIFQIGNMEDTAVGTPEGKTASLILSEFYKRFEKNNPHIYVINAVIHMDESTPHLHIDFIPVATESKRGLSTRNSRSKALEQQGFTSEGKLNTCSRQWINIEKQRLAECMTEYNIEHIVLGNDKSNLSVEEFKLQKRTEEVAKLEEKINLQKQELSALDKTIDDKQEMLNKITDKEVEIKNLDNIPTENTMFSDKVKINREDYYTLLNTSKKYYTFKNDSSILKAHIEVLENENMHLEQTVSEHETVISDFRITINTLKQEVLKLRKLIDKFFAFIDKFNLRDKWEQFLQKSKKRDIDIDR